MEITRLPYEDLDISMRLYFFPYAIFHTHIRNVILILGSYLTKNRTLQSIKDLLRLALKKYFIICMKKSKKLTSDSFLGSISRKKANEMRFETPKLQIPKYQKYGKMPSWKSQNFIKTLKSLPLRILESVGGEERTF